MATYYVSVNGSNTGNGSAASPFRTISKAMWKLAAGDEVIVGPGTYNEMVRISANGTADNPITVRSAVPGAAKIVTNQTFGVHVQGDYVKVDGFDISGASGAGVTANLTHHVTISNNIVHDNGSNGISASRSDFTTIEGNVTYRNAANGPYSGISVYHPENITGDTTTYGYRIIVRNNVSYDNVTKTGAHSDGNGIIMDDFRSTQDLTRTPYLFPSLVENNVVYNNGGKGVQVDWSDYVTVRNNTSWHNNLDPKKSGTWHGELSNMNASHNTWVNNIAVADPTVSGTGTAIDNTSNNGYINSDNIWRNNLTYNGTSGDDSVRTTGGNTKLSPEHGNLLGINPMFLGAPGNFTLHPDSLAIDGGTKNYGFPVLDSDGNPRQGGLDMGAIESGTRPEVPPPAPAIRGTVANDFLAGTANGDLMYGDLGNDVMQGNAGNDTINGESGHDQLYGGLGDDLLNGGMGNNRIFGEAGNDTLFSLNGGDWLDGGAGNDLLRSGAGKDTLIGGTGADSFVFSVVTDAGNGLKSDEIRDFSSLQGDKINLSGIDADTGTTGNQAFTFIGANAFSGIAGELQYVNGRLAGDINGDGVTDLFLNLIGNPALSGGDILL
nr:right-handed parallel beta-helix repeat-containing protein [Amaricoccus macauensis]